MSEVYAFVARRFYVCKGLLKAKFYFRQSNPCFILRKNRSIFRGIIRSHQVTCRCMFTRFKIHLGRKDVVFSSE